MRVKVMAPNRIVVDARADHVTAEALDGSFSLLPRHVDLATALAPGLLALRTREGVERHVAVDGGLLVKCGEEVLVSTRRAVVSDDLDALERAVTETFQQSDEAERRARMAVARLEADLVRRFAEWEAP
jgi:F-type H+-transporting ATPase subunit epsilon